MLIRTALIAALTFGVATATTAQTDLTTVSSKRVHVPQPNEVKRAAHSRDSNRLGKELNRYRKSKGLNSLTRAKGLDKAAAAHLDDMRRKNYFAHVSPTGSKPGARARANGCPNALYVGENLGLGHESVSHVMARWKKSPGHNINMLRDNSQYYGMASNGHLWVLVVAASC